MALSLIILVEVTISWEIWLAFVCGKPGWVFDGWLDGCTREGVPF
jgi:hypothetical protein